MLLQNLQSPKVVGKAGETFDRYRIQVIDRTVLILNCFGLEQRALSVGEIDAIPGLHRRAAHCFLVASEYNELIKHNWLWQLPAKYRRGAVTKK